MAKVKALTEILESLVGSQFSNLSKKNKDKIVKRLGKNIKKQDQFVLLLKQLVLL